MKVRNGFVSNSSSSSFIIVGVTGKDTIKKLLKKDKPQSSWGGVSNGGVVNFYGGWYDSEEENNVEDINHVGIEIEAYLKQDKTISAIKKIFVNKVKDQLDIEIPIEKVGFYYGEASSE